MERSFISLAIEQLNTDNFELWCQEVITQEKNLQFEPTGGMHDGGQDGFLRAVSGDISHYVQISKDKNTGSKIRRTIKRLKETRQVKQLTYITSQNENDRDLLEVTIKKESGVEVVIHDQRWLQVRAQLDDKIKERLFAYSKDLVEGLTKIQGTERVLNVSSRLSIVSYLEAHVRSLPEAENFQNICLDTLVYNALIDTDPEKGEFRTPEEIEEFVSKEHKNVLEKAECTLQDRLEFLTSKANDPRIRRHPGDRYALPYSVRNAFNDDNLKVKNVGDRFLGSINHRLNGIGLDDIEVARPFVISAVQGSIVKTYQNQAMNFAASFTNREFETDIKVFEIIRQIVSEMDVPSDLVEIVVDATTKVFRIVCYSSNDDEREYLNQLLKFFTINFLMDGDAAVSRYFSEMASKLRIYVGTDILVRCLSEALVLEPSRGMTNSLKLLAAAGVRLRVTRQTVGEVFAHIRHSTGVFRSEYESWFRHAKLDEVKNCDRILIRSFFYAYLEPGRHTQAPRDWSDYLRRFGAAVWFSKTDEPTSEEYLDEFASFLIDKFNLEFVEIDEVISGIDSKLVDKIAREIIAQRDRPTDGGRILARNDAQMSLFVNAERITNKERVTSDLYGFNTWWLTEETAVLRALRKYGQKDDVVMHPQFLMNHFILDPGFIKRSSGEDRSITPTLFGLRITDRVPPGQMREFLRGIGDLAGLDEAAQKARIRRAANRLKRRPKRTADQAIQ